MKLSFLRVSALVLAYCFFFANGAAGSAEITISKEAGCDILLNGDIAEGDVARLETVHRDALAKVAPLIGTKLCLNSPEGGSFAEAINIIQWLMDTGNITTIVDQDGKCYSACAFAFMFGNFNEGDGLTGPVRKLHYKGTLGFHTPFINPPVNSDDRVLTSKAYLAGVKAVRQILAADWDNWVPKSLLVAALGADPSEFVEVDTVARAAAWKTEVVGFAPPKRLTQAMLERACLNSARNDKSVWSGRWWDAGGSPSGQREQLTLPETPIQLANGHYRKVIKGFGAENQTVCVVDVYDAGKHGLRLTIEFTESAATASKPQNPRDVASQENFNGTPIWYVFAGDTKLRDLPSK